MTKDPGAEVVIGEIVAPFGIRGEVKVRLDTDYPERFLDMSEATLRAPDESRRTLKIEGVRFHKGLALIKFQYCDDMSAAEELRGSYLVIPESELRELPENEFYIHEIVGLCVYTVDGRDLGEILEVIRGPVNDAYLTSEAIIPALKSVVREVDLEGRRMIVDLPE
ncbi:MAG: ribosome maturation factor RimM [Armatimonadota bacterium]|nr:ribosome maturation factor RimM [Armatimonadota bacterium]